MEEEEEKEVDNKHPGPVDPSVLYNQQNHVSSSIYERGVLRCHEHTSKLSGWHLTPKQLELVSKAGFSYFRLLPSFPLDNHLISALVERWRPETNTFHLPVGEMTLTLKDVALLLGLPIDGLPVFGLTHTKSNLLCHKFLGQVPHPAFMTGGMLKLSWLKDVFSHCPHDASPHDTLRHTRAYLLYLIGSTIFSTTTGNKVPVMYLPLFEDFDKAGNYAWGAAALSFLYRSLGRACLKSQTTISGSLTLLQCWSYFHLNVGRPKFYQEPLCDCFPFALRWKGKQSATSMKRVLVFYRTALDTLDPCDVDWLPYRNMNSTLIPENIKSSLILGRSKTMLICFDKAERHLPDRCLRQHGMLQGIPADVQQWERKTRGVDSGLDLAEKMELELKEWSSRQLHIVLGDDTVDENEYMNWYLAITLKFIGRPASSAPQLQRTVKFRTKKKRLNAALRDIAKLADSFSTKGLNSMQLESMNRIRAIAHDCLGDRVGGAITVAAPARVELGKGTREKERVGRNSNGKLSWNENLLESSTSFHRELYDAAAEGNEMKQCPSDRGTARSEEVVALSRPEPGERVHGRERAGERKSKKRKQMDWLGENEAGGNDIGPQSFCRAGRNDQVLSFLDDSKVDQVNASFGTGDSGKFHICHTDDEDNYLELCHAAGLGCQPQQISHAKDGTISVQPYLSTGEDEKPGSHRVVGEREKTAEQGDHSQPSQIIIGEDEKAVSRQESDECGKPEPSAAAPGKDVEGTSHNAAGECERLKIFT